MIKKQAERILLERKKARRWLALILCMALLATSGVFAWLRMDGQAMDETGRILDCKYKVHSHGHECYDDEGNLACGQADYVIHEHDASCYGEDGQLVCTLEEHKAHVHDESCYEEKKVLACGQEEAVESTQAGSQAGDGTGQGAKDSGEAASGESGSNVVHVHTEECYETQKVLACGEIELHTHDEKCYDEDGNLTCGKLELKEHKHGEECFRDATEDGDPDEAGGTAGRDTVSGDSASGNSMSVDSVDESTSSGSEKTVSRDTVSGSEGTAGGDAVGGSEKTVSGDTASGSTEGASLTQEAETENYLVTATYGEEAGIPEDAQLKVQEITEKTNPGQWKEKAEASREAIGDGGAEVYFMLDIGFYGPDGEEIEPTSPVQVNVQDKEKEKEGKSDNEEVSIVHFTGEEGREQPEPMGDYTADAEGNLTFEADAFSVYVVLIPAQSTEKNKAQITYKHSYTPAGGETKDWTGTVTFTVSGNGDKSSSGYTLSANAYEEGSGDSSINIKNEDYKKDTNDIQYYNIYWVSSDGGHEALDDNTSVQIEWDNSSGLYGEDNDQGRFARVLSLSSNGTGGFTYGEEQGITALAESDDGVVKGYSTITFTATQEGPYAIVSEQVFTGYVSKLTVAVTSDGTATFNTEKDSSGSLMASDKGYDTSDKNGVVRSFDSIAYGLSLTTASRSDYFRSLKTTACFEMTMKMGMTEAEFDFSQLSWAETEGASWLIEYLDGSGNVVATRDASCDEGYVIQNNKKVSINAITKGSNQGENSYKDTLSIAAQRLTGTYEITSNDESKPAVPSTQTFTAGIKVLNATNGKWVEPTFRMWLEGNEENLGYDTQTSTSGEQVATAQPNSVEMKEPYDAVTNSTAYAVTVSAGAFYNVEINQNGYLMYASWFDFDKNNEVSACSYTVNGQTISGEDVVKLLDSLANLHQNWGKSNPADFTDDTDKYITEIPADVAPEYPNGTTLGDYTGEKGIFLNIRYGRMFSYGIALQMANLNKDGEYGMKGLSLPVGTISLDLDLTTSASGDDVTSGKVDRTQFYSILWDSSENDAKNNGKQERNFYWQNSNNSKFARAAVPYNHTLSNKVPVASSCYDGGTWTLSGINGTSSAATNVSTTDVTYTFQISGYDIDLSSYTFPTNRAMSSGVLAQYASYEYNFSAGQVQVLSVFPRVNSGTVQDNMEITAGNLNVTDLSGRTLSSTTAGTKTIGYSYETNTYGQDNYKNMSVTFYEPGSIQKRNSFIKRSGYDLSGKFLGQTGSSDTFWVTSWDATAFIGEEFAIIGTGEISEKSDANIEAFNLLQLFDSSAFVLADGSAHINESGSLNSTNGSYYVSTTDTDKNTVILLENGDKTTKWTSATILYAADPDYPKGYNTNGYTKSDGTVVTSSEMQEYMNGVREEDLVYYKTLSGLESAGYTCVGVLAEVRGCENILKGYDNGRIALRIPVTLKDDPDLVGKTVSTINSLRVWTTEGAMMKDGASISWANGIWNTSTGKNVLTDYQTIITLTSKHLSGENGIAQENSGNKYTKVEYQDGQKESGDTGGYYYGNTLLILSYKAGIKIDSEKAEGNKTYDLSKESDVKYTLSGINTSLGSNSATSSSTATSLNIGVKLSGTDSNGAALNGTALDVILLGEFQMKVPAYAKNDDGTYKTDGNENYSPVYETDENGNYITDEDGNKVQAKETVTFSKDNSVTVIVEYDGICYPVTFSVTMGEGNQSAAITVVGAPVGATLPDITLPASLGNGLANGSHVTATATISGSGDQRAYDTVNGNLSTDTVSIVKLAGSSLAKAVDTTLMEQDGTVTYTITYTNTGNNTIDKAYFYDILPYNGDIRGTDFTGSTYLTGISANSVNRQTGETSFKESIDFYYSTVSGNELRGYIEGFNGFNSDDVDNMLVNGKTTGETGKQLFHKLGTLSANETEYSGTELIYDQSFEGETGQETGVNDGVASQISCVYAVVQGIPVNESLNLYLTLGTKDNAGADIYGNVAWGWSPGTGSLRSNIVKTRVVSRSISGVVWHDANLNGKREDGEPRVGNVECTLFKKEGNEYTVCEKDVTGASIGNNSEENDTTSAGTITTGTDGSYCFDKLAAGDYVVAFKGSGLAPYTGSTFYQVNGSNDANTNDGMGATGNAETILQKINQNVKGEYQYLIVYKKDSSNGGDEIKEEMSFHNIDQYKANSSLLTNYEEKEENQDIGFITPEIAKINRSDIKQVSENSTPQYSLGTDSVFLEGAEFVLEQNGTKKYYGKTSAADEDSTGGITGIISWYKDESCQKRVYNCQIEGGTYILKETKAPTGYALNDAEWTVKYEEGRLTEMNGKTPETVNLTRKVGTGNKDVFIEVQLLLFPDTMLYTLPSAGGMGIYWDTAGGMALMMAAAFLMFQDRKKRQMKARQ